MTYDFWEFWNDFIVCYIKNILIYSKDIKKYKLYVLKTQVLQKLRDARLYTKIEKCVFHNTWVDFLAFIISNDGLIMDFEKIQIIMDLKILKIILMSNIFWDLLKRIGFLSIFFLKL